MDLVRSHILPVEALHDKCPVCRVGIMVSLEQAFEVGGYLLFGQQQPEEISKLCCKHCGFCYIMNQKQLNATLAKRKNLQ